MNNLPTRLNSTNAINGDIILLVTETRKSTGAQIARYTQTYNDTDADYGDAYNADERAMLAAGHPVRRESHGIASEIRCMVTATLKN